MHLAIVSIMCLIWYIAFVFLLFHKWRVPGYRAGALLPPDPGRELVPPQYRNQIKNEE